GGELGRVDQRERECGEGWERSCQPREITTQEKTDLGAGAQKDSRLKAGMRTEKRDGNPAFLDGVQWCLEHRAKILGVFAPTKIAPVTPDGQEQWHASDDDTRAILQAAYARFGLRLDPAGIGGATHARG